MNPEHLNKLCEKIAVLPDHLRYIYGQIERHLSDCIVWAFGSRITHSHRPSSDLDLAVHCDSDTVKQIIPKLKDIFEESDLPFKVQILDYNRLPPNMQENIKKKYVVLYQPRDKTGEK